MCQKKSYFLSFWQQFLVSSVDLSKREECRVHVRNRIICLEGHPVISHGVPYSSQQGSSNSHFLQGPCRIPSHSSSCTFILVISTPHREGTLTPILQMKTQDTSQICTSWISWRGFQITLNQPYAGAATESNSSDFLSSSLPVPQEQGVMVWGRCTENLPRRAPNTFSATSFLPGGCVSIAASAREGWSTELGLLFFTQHESNSADASIGRICTHCPEYNLNLLPALGPEIGISAFQLPFPWHTGCCCCTQTG